MKKLILIVGVIVVLVFLCAWSPWMTESNIDKILAKDHLCSTGFEKVWFGAKIETISNPYAKNCSDHSVLRLNYDTRTITFWGSSISKVPVN